MKTRFLLVAGFFACNTVLRSAPLTESTFTEIVKDVNVVAAATKAAEPAKVNELLKAPDLVRTGPESRAELTAPDQTITRVGANTVFSFEPAGRNMNLEKGSLLFHSPVGKGGGSIRSGGASAAVLGTTIIVAATDSGGFKVIVLEGKGTVTLPSGNSVTLTAGQLVFVLPGQTDFGPVLDINLGKLVAGSQLVNGFSNPLSSQPLIRKAVEKQDVEISSGKAQDTGMPPENFARKNQGKQPANGMNAIDNTSYQAGVAPSISQAQINFIDAQQKPPPGFNPGSRGTAVVGPK